MEGNTVSLTLWALNAVCYPPYVAACARTCSDRRRSAADASAGPPGKYPSGRTWCPHRWRGPLQQQQKRKGKKIVKINFTSHTFKADLEELQFLSFFLVFFSFGFFIIFYFYVWQFQVRLLMAPCAHILAKKSCELWQVLPVVSDCLHWDFAYADGSWKFYSQFWEREKTLETRSCECLFWQQKAAAAANHMLGKVCIITFYVLHWGIYYNWYILVLCYVSSNFKCALKVFMLGWG